jgi:hypothetical protein
MKSWKNISGWTDFENIYQNVINNSVCGDTLVEVGCWLGRSSAMMCEKIRISGKPLKFFCVDTWRGSPELMEQVKQMDGDVFPFFLKNMRQHAGLFAALRMDSVKAAKTFPDFSCSFVFIDACHEYKSVIKDIRAWLPKVKTGGIIAGHDYDFPGVNKAVNESFKNVIRNGRSWLVEI